MSHVINRLEMQDWFTKLPEEERRAHVESLMRDPAAQERVEDVLDLIDHDPDWRTLTPVQQKAQVLGVIEMERMLRLQRESLEELTWYEDLGPLEQDEVRRTVELGMRINAATLRTAYRPDEKRLLEVNPWSGVLGLPRK